MAIHTEDALTGACITQVLNLPLAVPALEACGAECLVSGKNGEVLDLVATRAATVRAVVAYKGAVAQEEKVGVRVQQCSARVAAETSQVPSMARC